MHLILILLLLSVATSVDDISAAEIVINEFLAANSAGIVDEDGDASDWIELYNPAHSTADLTGWYLTDDRSLLTKWRFPQTTLLPGEYLLVFASGKDRRLPGSELHANFKLDSDGEYLALVSSNGIDIVQEFSPAFPLQHVDASFGISHEVLQPELVTAGSQASILVPADDSLGLDWTGRPAQEPFDDSLWGKVSAGIGYDHGLPGEPPGVPGLIGYWDFNDFADPDIALDASGNNNHGTITSNFQLTGTGGDEKPLYSDAGSGYSLDANDRALDFGVGGNGAIVEIAESASGIFDSATANDAITISLWIYGNHAQPANCSIFWGSSNVAGDGTRSLNAHIPWGDRTIYWDTSGCCNSTQRVSKLESNSDMWKGRWNHYALIKNGDTKQIWQNGQLFLQGDNTADLTQIRNFVIGGAKYSGGLSYSGLMDDVAIWDNALDKDLIEHLARGVSPLALSSLSPLITTDVSDAMLDRNASIYIRIPFDVDLSKDFDAMIMRLYYDDGFVAYLNGIEILRSNAPDTLAYNAKATMDRQREDVLHPVDFDLSGHIHLLNQGENILSFQALNDSISSHDFLFYPELWLVKTQKDRYMKPPTPGTANVAGAVDFVDDTRFDIDRGFFTEPFHVEISCDTPEAQIFYTTDGTEPDPASDDAMAYTGPIFIEETTCLRAAAFKTGYYPANIDTQTYIFVDQVSQQSANPAGLPAHWSGGFPADYEVDPDVVDTTLPGYSFEEALVSIPTISIVATPEHLFSPASGIYYNSQNKVEVPASVEMIYPYPREGFQIDAGVRIHGNTSRRHTFTPKHSFRVVFKGEFGASKLNYKLFDDSDVNRFDQFVLKGLSTDTWCVEDGWPLRNAPAGTRRWYRENAQYIREQWMKDSMHAMGQISTHGSFVHVYLNGLYWGLYNLTERPTNTFQAGYFGGDKEEYDVLKDYAEIHDGNMQAWNEVMSLCSAGFQSEAAYQYIQGNNPDGTRNADYQRYVDVENLIDYMILHIYAGADDWPRHNWWVGRRRGDFSQGFKFFAWDQEISNSANNQYGYTSSGYRFEYVNSFDSPAYIYARMRENPSFRMKFADHVHKHLFNGGALTPESSRNRWTGRATEIDHAMVGESARWGDARRSTPFKREVEWLAQRNWLQDVYWDAIPSMVLQRFKNVDLYPDVAPPAFSQHGGIIEPGFQLAITVHEGTVFYTLNGQDPRDRNGGISPHAVTYAGESIPLAHADTVKARTFHDNQWSAMTEALFCHDIPLRISEIMYHPQPPPAGSLYDSKNLEYVEILNTGHAMLDLSGYTLSGGIRFTFSQGVGIRPGEYMVIAKNMSAFSTRYNTDGLKVLGEFEGSLENFGERLALIDPEGMTIVSFSYQSFWHPETDGDGYSLVPIDPGAAGQDWDDRDNWRSSLEIHGSPGREDRYLHDNLQLPGDVNQDAALDLSDAIGLLVVLFGSEYTLPCDGETPVEGGNLAVLDVNGDENVDLSDVIYTLTYLFSHGPEPVLGASCIPVEGCPGVCAK